MSISTSHKLVYASRLGPVTRKCMFENLLLFLLILPLTLSIFKGEWAGYLI